MMGHDHSGTATQHAGSKHRWRLAVAFVLIGSFFAVELIAGLLSGSLALLSDAGHMAADVVTLGAALVATRIATRTDTTGRRTYGSYRAEVFAAGLATLVMLGVAVYITVEALNRIGSDAEVAFGPMLIVGVIGLVINVVALVLLRSGAQESLNVKGAYLEVIGDTAGSVGVIVAGLLVATTGEPLWDTVIALAIGVFVIVRAIILGRQVIAVLGQHAPAGIDVQAVADELAAIDTVADVHDLHVWTLTSGMHVATAHLVTTDAAASDRVLQQGGDVLEDRYGVAHATVQIETAGRPGCHKLSW